MQELQGYLLLTALALFIIMALAMGCYIIKLALFPDCKEQREMIAIRIIMVLSGLILNILTITFVIYLVQLAYRCCSK